MSVRSKLLAIVSSQSTEPSPSPTRRMVKRRPAPIVRCSTRQRAGAGGPSEPPWRYLVFQMAGCGAGELSGYPQFGSPVRISVVVRVDPRRTPLPESQGRCGPVRPPMGAGGRSSRGTRRAAACNSNPATTSQKSPPQMVQGWLWAVRKGSPCPFGNVAINARSGATGRANGA